MNRPDPMKAFLRTIEHFRYEHHIYDVFRDWTELAAEVHQAPYHAGLSKDEAFDHVEAECLAAAKKYESKNFDVLSRCWALYFDTVE